MRLLFILCCSVSLLFSHEIPSWMREEVAATVEALGPAQARFDAASFYKEGARVDIVNGKVVVSPTHIQRKPLVEQRLSTTVFFLKEMMGVSPLPNCSFYLYVGDSYSGPLAHLPILSYSSSKPGIFLIPDCDALMGYEKLTQNIFEANKKYPWKNKVEKLFWRGATTGGDYNSSNWREMARSKMVLFALKHPRLANARFSSRCQGAESVSEMRYLLGSYITSSDAVAFKYLVDIDGNACTYSRCYWILLSNSVMLKQVTRYRQWYYRGLTPGLHYIPLEEDLSDLEDKLAWAKEHDEECRHMAKAATRFAVENLNKEQLQSYFRLVINQVERLQRR